MKTTGKKDRNAAKLGEYGEFRKAKVNASIESSTSYDLEILCSKTDLMEDFLERGNMMAALKKGPPK